MDGARGHLRWGQPLAIRSQGLRWVSTRLTAFGGEGLRLWYPTHETVRLFHGWGTRPPAVGLTAFGREAIRGR